MLLHELEYKEVLNINQKQMQERDRENQIIRAHKFNGNYINNKNKQLQQQTAPTNCHNQYRQKQKSGINLKKNNNNNTQQPSVSDPRELIIVFKVLFC